MDIATGSTAGGKTGSVRTEGFTIGTRLTRVTRAMRVRDADQAIIAAGRTVPDWSGGTRLGETLQILLDRWGQNHHFLDTQLKRLQGELNRVTEARGRLRRVVPAYLGMGLPVESRLNTAA